MFVIIIIIIIIIIITTEICFVHQRVKIRHLCQNYTRILLSRPTNVQHIMLTIFYIS